MTTCSVEVNGCTIYHPYSPTEEQEDRACRLMNCKLCFRLPFDGPTQAFPLPLFAPFISENLVLKKITILLGPAHYRLAAVTIWKMEITLLVLCYTKGGGPGNWVKTLTSDHKVQSYRTGERCDGLNHVCNMDSLSVQSDEQETWEVELNGFYCSFPHYPLPQVSMHGQTREMCCVESTDDLTPR